ncbi:MAG: aminopeptidase [Bacteroidaceae bacterium]
MPLQIVWAQQSVSYLQKRLQDIPQVVKVTPMEHTEFAEKYELLFKQQVDKQHPEAGTFTQRVIIGHAGFDRPTLIVTTGYGAQAAFSPNYREELSRLFNMNMVFVEYRYFEGSTPSPLDWKYLTVENSLVDLHAITTALKKLYPLKWASTGISKGGQTTVFYRAYYPNDVDFSVPYVAPLCRAREDGRHEPFLENITGSASGRKRVFDYQTELFKRKAQLLPAFEKYCKEKGYHYRASYADIFDYCVLEYSFAFWQFGTPVDQIPAPDSSNEVLFDHFLKLSSPSYFADYPNDYSSFFVQAARELGYYGYDTKPFAKYLSITSSKDYLRRLMVPDGLQDIKFDPTLYKYTKKFLEKNDPKMIFIYGQNDPWIAPAVTADKFFKGKKNMHLFIQSGGSHRARIGTMPADLRDSIISQVDAWLKD